MRPPRPRAFHGRKRPLGLSEPLEETGCRHEIKLVVKGQVVGVLPAKFEAGHVPMRPPGLVDQPFVDVDADDVPCRLHAQSDSMRDRARSAADVEDAHSRGEQLGKAGKPAFERPAIDDPRRPRRHVGPCFRRALLRRRVFRVFLPPRLLH